MSGYVPEVGDRIRGEGWVAIAVVRYTVDPDSIVWVDR